MIKNFMLVTAISLFPVLSQAMNLNCGSDGFVGPGTVLVIRSVLSPVEDPNWKVGKKMVGPAEVKLQSSTVPTGPNGPTFTPNAKLRGIYSLGPSFTGHLIDSNGSVSATISIRGNNGIYRPTPHPDQPIKLNCTLRMMISEVFEQRLL